MTEIRIVPGIVTARLHRIFRGHSVNPLTSKLLRNVSVALSRLTGELKENRVALVHWSCLQDSEQKIVGVLGVIGPTRLNYGRIIPMVDYTARPLGRLVP